MNAHLLIAVAAILCSACNPAAWGPKPETVSLSEARSGFPTKLIARPSDNSPAAEPPPDLFQKVTYPSPIGKLTAYLSIVPTDGQKHPAIVWITGGDCNSIGPVWVPQPRENDQTASAFREAGIITMYPALRGGNGGPGTREGYFGEVDDVIAAGLYLAEQPGVDPKRIYLGGHSSGGTLVMLVAASSDRFRAVFAFGPADDVSHYDKELLPFDISNRREIELRSPGRWIHSIRSPTFIFEGAEQPSNVTSLGTMASRSTNPLVHFLAVPGVNHFSILYPQTHQVADKILHDTGESTHIGFGQQGSAE